MPSQQQLTRGVSPPPKEDRGPVARPAAVLHEKERVVRSLRAFELDEGHEQVGCVAERRRDRVGLGVGAAIAPDHPNAEPETYAATPAPVAPPIAIQRKESYTRGDDPRRKLRRYRGHSRRFEIDQATFVHLREGRATEIREIADTGSLLWQLGGLSTDA